MFVIDKNCTSGKNVRHVPSKRSGRLMAPVAGKDTAEVKFDGASDVETVALADLRLDLSGSVFVVS